MKKLIVHRVSTILFLIALLAVGQTVMGQVDQTVYHVKHNVANGSYTIPGDSELNYEFYGTSTTSQIIVESDYSGTIKFRDLDMKLLDLRYSVVRIEAESSTEHPDPPTNTDPITKVTIVLEGDNKIIWGAGVYTNFNYYGYCCIEIEQGAQVHFRAVDENDNTSGTLEAYIRDSSGALWSATGGAAIGSAADGVAQGQAMLYQIVDNVETEKYLVNSAGGNIIISSGTIRTEGGHGSGIGGGYQTYYDGIIVIYGGDVSAKSFRHSAGIGSGCPTGNGVLRPPYGSSVEMYTENSAIIVLPPAKINSYGSHTDLGVPVAELALAGTRTLIYVNDPEKPVLTIHTEDDEPNADIFADLTETPELVHIFDILGLNAEYDLKAAKFGRTDAILGKFVVNAQLDQPITFFTDKSSSGLKDPEKEGRPYLPKKVTIPAGTNADKYDIELEFLPIDIFMEIFEVTSKPLVQGYTSTQAHQNAYHVKILYKDAKPMTQVKHELEDGSSFGPMVFLAADSATVISAPTQLQNGDIYYVIVPMKDNLSVGNYSDILAISGIWNGQNTGKIRKRPEQRVVLDDTGTNKHIKVTADPTYGGFANPADFSVTLTLNIDHTGLPGSFNKDDIQARYIVTTEPDYDKAVAALAVNKWPYMNTPTANATNTTTTITFADKTSGTWYVHWFVISGSVYAHSQTVVGPPPAKYGGFGPFAVVNVKEDLSSVFEYGTVGIDVFGNDELQSLKPGSALATVTAHPKAGELLDNGEKLIYKHTNKRTLTHDIDSFTYRVKIGEDYLSTTCYIYVIRTKSGGFIAPIGSNYTIELMGAPDKSSNVTYTWYDKLGVILTPPTGHSRTITNIQTDTELQVAPRRSVAPYANKEFPAASFTVKAIASTAAAKWVGTVDTNWHNPENWVLVENGVETTATWIPSADIDVIIASGVPNYPELKQSASCRDIKMEDRAMIAGIHWLDYRDASVEIVLTAEEKGRFVMWSAPLESMYSGDYHYKNDYNQIQLGDVYMNLFQHDHPAGGSAAINSFTATFGELGKPLPLGTAFNVQILPSSGNRNRPFTFPQVETTYTDQENRQYNLNRTNSSKFIADKRMTLTLPDSTFAMPVHNDKAGSELVQVVNPYMAYLDISKFLNGNTDKLGNSYAIWNGDVNKGFISELAGPVGQGNRYKISTIPSNEWKTSGVIAPLQSFFVTKKNTALITSVKMSPNWTNTTGSTHPYVLRSGMEENVEQNVLRITAEQGGKISYALLHNDQSASVSYNADEDTPKPFYDAIAMEVYSLADNKPVSINSMGDFSRGVKLGIRTKEEGQITLNFERFAGFNHNIYLIDNSRDGKKEINLQTTPSYSFKVEKSSENEGFVEINDRFSLRFVYTTTANEQPGVENELQVTQQEDHLYIRSLSGTINTLFIYTVDGSLIYSSNTDADYYQVNLPRYQTYIVKATINGKEFIQKIVMK
ncbi:hypothetical protein [Parabacteroides sp. PF5-9]|uniref:hypothetical protein n=1 Tax=Parabacteroides sp. PF5-9 TaxID=1742404 RepID=UPI002475B45D|nr:hypothetical protein [Parabacteroides sp. PF5-9]MDH6358693.1 hypothetical protein [Parabacteroides sp. PF5-9]